MPGGACRRRARGFAVLNLKSSRCRGCRRHTARCKYNKARSKLYQSCTWALIRSPDLLVKPWLYKAARGWHEGVGWQRFLLHAAYVLVLARLFFLLRGTHSPQESRGVQPAFQQVCQIVLRQRFHLSVDPRRELCPTCLAERAALKMAQIFKRWQRYRPDARCLPPAFLAHHASHFGGKVLVLRQNCLTAICALD